MVRSWGQEILKKLVYAGVKQERVGLAAVLQLQGKSVPSPYNNMIATISYAAQYTQTHAEAEKPRKTMRHVQPTLKSSCKNAPHSRLPIQYI